ncbi:cation transporter [Halobacillus salinarum]|uniref:Cation transporter n=1 Tax=Halobacillus salinarum TaxID=2932257 RepID=A0ABY4ENI0_9BACI|nr:cation transporter [Halobacillus salinarum]UOQ46013.1 cation transporter [Halobacillus salinarum]
MELTLEVNGMNGEKSEKQVKETLEALEGVYGVEIDISSRKVNVSFDAAYVTKGLMKEAIESQGYEPVG